MLEKIITALLLFFNLTSVNTAPQNENFAFQDLTIPYLRNINYGSNINGLEFYSENDNYASYLTSYDSDGLKINGLITIPNSVIPDGGFPAIVFVHGYIPPESYKTTEKYISYVDSLASAGFIVFKIDLRGHGNSEGIASGAYYSSDYVIDILNAYAALSTFEKVNPKKIGLWGHSMAGNIISRSVAVKKDIPAVVIWAGAGYTYSDLLEYKIGDNSYVPPINNTERQIRRKQLMENYGQFDPDSWFWKQVPFVNYLDGVDTKLQLHHAIDDSVVDIEYSRNLKNILSRKNFDIELFEYKTGGHNISGSSFNEAMQETVNFFKKSL